MKKADATAEIAIGNNESQWARGEPVPAVQVDADEDRLEKEGGALQREGQADDGPRVGHEPREQEAQLEADDRARRRAHGKQHAEHLRPPAGEGTPHRIAGAQVHPLGHDHHQRQPDAEYREEQVKAERGAEWLRPAVRWETTAVSSRSIRYLLRTVAHGDYYSA
jgi:hypothetical protein